MSVKQDTRKSSLSKTKPTINSKSISSNKTRLAPIASIKPNYSKVSSSTSDILKSTRPNSSNRPKSNASLERPLLLPIPKIPNTDIISLESKVLFIIIIIILYLFYTCRSL